MLVIFNNYVSNSIDTFNKKDLLHSTILTNCVMRVCPLLTNDVWEFKVLKIKYLVFFNWI
jgi:hypothetical protein